MCGRAMLAPTETKGSPSRGAPAAAGEGCPGGQISAPNHPSVTFGDSSPQGEPSSTAIEFISAPEGSIGEEAKSVKKRAALLHVLAFCFFDHIFGVPRGERLAAHNERRQFAAQTRSCGYSPRWGEHCSLPVFAALNRGPLLATPQSPRPGFAASEQRDFFRFLFWSQKRKASRKKPSKKRGAARWPLWRGRVFK